MPKRYFNQHDVEMRLDAVIALYKGEPYSISAVNNEYPKITLKPLYGNKNNQIIDHDDSSLDTSFPELGYFNYAKHAIWLSKNPDRRQAQGLRSKYLISHPKIFGGFCYTKEFHNFLKKQYPSVDEALEKVRNENVISMAVSRNFALSRENKAKMSLMYRRRPIGYYNERLNEFKLDQTEESSFIIMAMNKSGVFNGKNYG